MLYTPRATAKRMAALPGAAFVSQPRHVGNAELGLIGATSTLDVTQPCPSFLIEHDRGLVLFDTGFDPRGLDDMAAYYPEISKALPMAGNRDLGIDRQLDGLGYRPSQISYVIPSHLHFDHAGGLYLFPDSTFLMGSGEMAFALQAHDKPQAGFFRVEDLLPTRHFDWIETAHDFDLFGDGSVVLLFSPGHTPGSLALFVRLPNQNIILSGDVCHFPLEVDMGIIATSSFSPSYATFALRRLRMISKAWDARIWIQHEEDHWNEWPHAPEYID
ncbi:N-acyl homoserine lactonase family protein [Pseudofrankia sp. BMG5.37]|uniref:N-acyl homoserine lactonase family protein n=1 Tax=Pseudofrankia sp. BMG5.37 TaxID=3050035 RepID=UPI0028940CBA|nr:N-acyl homoserine lactonase family protein [Pseudofrankia sp. BMG5.37]MDT3444931.1 N-acyl homoserine lactonase family protein [Pseudofrankia sp. BMG5.37]